jgi:hypothetical protein
MKFQIGDKVKFKKELIVGRCYDGFGFSSDMDKQKDKIFEIIEIDNEDFRIKVYQESSSDFMCTKYWVTESMIDITERVHKRLFVNQTDLRQYGTYSDWNLEKCPKCSNKLHWNSYKDLYVGKDHDEKTFKIIMEYCDECEELYICYE